MTSATTERPTVLVTAPLARELTTDLERDFTVRYMEPNSANGSLASVARADDLAAAQVIIAELDEIDEETLAGCPALKLVVDCRAAPVNVDIDACTRHGVAVATTPGRNADSTADVAFTLLLETVRKTSQAERWMRTKAWSPEQKHYPYEVFRGPTLKGHTLGVVGGGAVGGRMVDRAQGFGMKVKVYDPFLPTDAFAGRAEMVGLEDLMKSSDVVTVHVPLNKDTTATVKAEHIAMMKPDAYFIMAGRAATVDMDAVLDALRHDRIAGAGFDVYLEEPLSADSELFDLPNVTMTPHIAGASDGVIEEQTRMAVDSVQAWAADQPMRAVANRKELGLS